MEKCETYNLFLTLSNTNWFALP